MAKALPSITRRGRSFSLPLSLPKTNGPTGISISGFPGIGSSSPEAAPLTRIIATAALAQALEIHAMSRLLIEQEHALGRDAHPHHLVEIARKIFVGAHGQQGVAGAH